MLQKWVETLRTSSSSLTASEVQNIFFVTYLELVKPNVEVEHEDEKSSSVTGLPA